jgi:hypothetical protein
MRRRPEGRPRSESVHCKRSLGGMSRADVSWGPRFSSTAPPSTPIPLHQISPWAWPRAPFARKQQQKMSFSRKLCPRRFLY